MIGSTKRRPRWGSAALPIPRGAISRYVVTMLRDEQPDEAGLHLALAGLPSGEALLNHDDAQLALNSLHELHFRGFRGVSDDHEWQAELVLLRIQLEAALEAALREVVDCPQLPTTEELPDFLFDMTAPSAGPSLSKYLARRASLAEFTEFLIHRCAYHSKEADPYTWAIPRLAGEAKSAMVSVQADEYGNGRINMMHSELFMQTLREVGLSDDYGTYIDRIPAPALVAVNTVNMFGLSRKFRGALAGHLSALEMTSSIPNRNYGNGLRRLGFSANATQFFDEHVEADAIHEQLAVRGLCAGLARQEPDQLPLIVFGVSTYLTLENRLADWLLGAWTDGRSSLRAVA
ncbi:MAG: iron-containing redox enzyme family protein [Candidatus Nanopelagicales bacterium]